MIVTKNLNTDYERALEIINNFCNAQSYSVEHRLTMTINELKQLVFQAYNEGKKDLIKYGR